MARLLRFKVTYYQHPSVTLATITSSPPPSPVSTLQSLPSITFTVSANTLSATAYLTIPPVTFF